MSYAIGNSAGLCPGRLNYAVNRRFLMHSLFIVKAHTLSRGFAPSGVAKDRKEQYQGKVTTYVIISCIVAAVGGSIFCCDIGISVVHR